jgi:hypothetical protein
MAMSKKQGVVTVESREICTLSESAAPAVLGEVLSGYVNHIGSCIDAAGNVFAAPTQDGASAGDVDVVILKRAVATGTWVEVWRFREAQYGKHGYGSIVVLSDGRLCCLLSERNAAGATVMMEHLLSGLASAAPTASGIDSVARAAIEALKTKLRAI